jgi:Arc/MetJ family transcription regulator
MTTNRNLDLKLVETAQKLGRHKTKREAVNRALREYVGWLRQRAILDQFRTIHYDPTYDYRKQRKVA